MHQGLLSRRKDALSELLDCLKGADALQIHADLPVATHRQKSKPVGVRQVET
jgi:hypothetical protein